MGYAEQRVPAVGEVGYAYSNFKEDTGARSLSALSSPLIDPYFLGEYEKNIREAKRFNLIRNTFSLSQ
jgi:hypothetical protein